tara:strand:+ start:701 stop:1636 length:936 start_codon:yes stop_codon:yes gene_type:complete
MSDTAAVAASPLVSVVIPAFDAAATIERAVTSVLAQDYRHIEVILVDDGSRDDTAARAESLRDPRLRVLRLPDNRGASAATNAGIAACRGSLVAFQDADDEWLPGKLSKQVAAIQRDPAISFVCTGLTHIYPDRRIDDIAGFPPGPELWKQLLARTLVAKPCVLARRDALRRAGPFDESLATAEDQDMWIRLALRGVVVEIPEILVLVHRQPGSLSAGPADRAAADVMAMLDRHLRALGARLSRAERRHILATRYAALGRSCYGEGHLLRGLRYLGLASVYGSDPRGILFYILQAAPPTRWLKRQYRRVRL